MDETKRAELAAAYDAVMAMLDMADHADFRFRVAIMGETRWVLLQKGAPAPGVAEFLGVQSLELSRCPTAFAALVYRRVLDIALTPIFEGQCLNQEDDLPELDTADPRSVIYLARYRLGAAGVDADNSNESDGPRVTVSGMMVKVDKSKSA